MKKRCTESGSRVSRGDGRFVGRLAVQVLGQDVGAAAHRQKGLLGDPRRLDRDVGRRVADPQHQHPLAAQDVRLAVVMDMHLLPGELLRPRKRRFGPARVPVVPVGDQHGAVAIDLPLLAGIDGHLPLPVHRLDLHHLGPEPDLLPKPEVIDVVVEVGGDLKVIRVVRVVRRHRIGPIGHQPPRGVDVQRPIGGRHPVVVFKPPVPPDLRALLKAVERNPTSVQDLTRSDPRTPGSDDANLRTGHTSQSMRSRSRGGAGAPGARGVLIFAPELHRGSHKPTRRKSQQAEGAPAPPRSPTTRR